MSFNVLANFDAFLTGMNLEASKETKDAKNIKKVVEDISKKLDNDFRGVYDSTIPNIHILDADYSARLLLKDLQQHPERYFSKYKQKDPEDGLYYEVDVDPKIAQSIVSDKDFLTESVKKSITKKIVDAVTTFHSNLPKKQTNPLEDLNAAMKESFLEMERALADTNLLPDARIALITKLGAKFKREIDKIFGKDALIALDIPELYSSSKRFVFFAKRFENMSTRINKEIGEAFKNALIESTKIKEIFIARQTLKIGDVIHFAHTGVKNGSITFLNTPAYAKLVFNTVNDPAGNKKSPFSSAYRASNYFKIQTGHTRLALKVSNTVGEKYGVLLSLGLTITTDHSSTLNLLVGERESKLSSGIFGSAQKATAALRNFLKLRGSGSIITKLATENPQFLQSSPSIVQKLRKQIVNVLTTGKSIEQVNRLNKTSSVKDFSYLKPKKVLTSKLNTKLKEKSKAKPSLGTSIAVTAKPPRKSPVDLVNLLNARLFEVIKSNMGSGNSTNILNYRTGRFAKSVKIEKISTSRQGMITAFYTYMKNPYATFSRGGRQEFPRTRDPKTLISKSIRDIAASLVTNQLRAVNV